MAWATSATFVMRWRLTNDASNFCPSTLLKTRGRNLLKRNHIKPRQAAQVQLQAISKRLASAIMQAHPHRRSLAIRKSYRRLLRSGFLVLTRTCELSFSSSQRVFTDDNSFLRGGGNVYNTGLDRGRPPLRWMVMEAGSVGLRTAPIEHELSLEEQIEIKESLTWIWWPFEFMPFPRLTFTRTNGRKITYR